MKALTTVIVGFFKSQILQYAERNCICGVRHGIGDIGKPSIGVIGVFRPHRATTHIELDRNVIIDACPIYDAFFKGWRIYREGFDGRSRCSFCLRCKILQTIPFLFANGARNAKDISGFAVKNHDSRLCRLPFCILRNTHRGAIVFFNDTLNFLIHCHINVQPTRVKKMRCGRTADAVFFGQVADHILGNHIGIPRVAIEAIGGFDVECDGG